MTSVIKVLALLLLLGGCATKPQLTISDYCEMSEVFQPSRRDTPQTLRWIAKQNAKYRKLCAGGEQVQ